VQTLGRSGKFVFYCSHVLEVVEKVCTDVLILRKGEVIAHDSVLLTFKMFFVCRDFFMASMRPWLLVELSEA
jgi:ABC-type multidrug transport system ATPase subunit